MLYVAGNHEHYHERIGRLHEKLRAAAEGSDVWVLENDCFELSGYRFFGATLWSDFNLFGDRATAMLAAGSSTNGMTDYRLIRRRDTGRLFPHHTADVHAMSRTALIQFLTSSEWARSIVITHHAPSQKSLPMHLHRDPMSPAFASNMDDLICSHGPALWVHGHIHETCDYTLGRTRVVNNALGYPIAGGHEARGFLGDLVVEV